MGIVLVTEGSRTTSYWQNVHALFSPPQYSEQKMGRLPIRCGERIIWGLKTSRGEEPCKGMVENKQTFTETASRK